MAISNEKQRVYFVIDMKSFFASVECAERGLNPMTTKLVVADESRTEKTVCLAISPALKALGIRNRCRLFEIPKGIDFIIAPPRMKKYIEYTANIYAIYLQYIDKSDIHVYSIDECFIDVTDYLKMYNMRAKEFAQKLLKEVLDKTHIPASVGIGTNLYLAKIALDITAKKTPDRIGWLTEEKYKRTLWNHRPLNDFWQISNGTCERLSKFGIYDMEGIAKFPEDSLYKEFGINAELLIDHAYGRESCLMSDIKNYKTKSHSMSTSQILPDDYTFDEALIVVKEMTQNGCYELLKHNYVTSLLHLGIIYGDGKKDSTKGTIRINSMTNMYSVIEPEIENLYRKIVKNNRLIRKLSIDFAELQPEDCECYDFFTDLKQIKKEKKTVKSILNIKNKYGKNSIVKALDLSDKATQIERNKQIGGHRGGEES